MKPKVLVTRPVYGEAIDYLREHVDLDYDDRKDGYTPEELRERARGKDGVVSQLTDRLDEHFFEAAPGLKVVSNVAVGFDNIDVAAATRRGVIVTNTPGVLTETTADFAFSLLMAAARRIPEADGFVRAGRWSRWSIDLMCGYDIHGRTLGILGAGRIGQAMAKRGSGFDMRVIYRDRIRLAEEREGELGMRFVPMPELLSQSDFLSVHVPLTPETYHLIGTRELASMKRTAVLINMSRGAVVDEAALADALAEKRIWSAALDVFEDEPNVHPKLLELDNVVLAPHIASASVATRTRMCTMAAENCVAVVLGQAPPSPVNPEVLGA